MSDVAPVDYGDDGEGRGEYVSGLIAGGIVGVALGAILIGMVVRKAPCPCEQEAAAGVALQGVAHPPVGYAEMPVPAMPAIPDQQPVANGGGRRSPLPPPTAERGPASPSSAPFPGVMPGWRPGSPVAGPWASGN